MLKVFLTLTPPKFFGVVGEDAHELLMTCRERLDTLGLVVSRGADITTYKLDEPARKL